METSAYCLTEFIPLAHLIYFFNQCLSCLAVAQLCICSWSHWPTNDVINSGEINQQNRCNAMENTPLWGVGWWCQSNLSPPIGPDPGHCSVEKCTVVLLVFTAVQSYEMQYSALKSSTVQCSAFQGKEVQYSTMQCFIFQGSTVQWSILQYSAVQIFPEQ